MSSHIAYLCSPLSWGGLEFNQLRNALWMQERGFEVVVLCVENTPVERHAREMGLRTITIRYHRKYYDFTSARALRKLLLAEKITHLVIRATRDLSIAATLKFRMGKKLHVSYFMEMQMGIKKTGLLHTLRYRYIDVWSCPLPYLHEQVRTMTRFRNTLCLIPSGMELAPFQADEAPADCRKLLELPSERFLFGLIGRFDPQKGQLLVLEAMKLCQDLPFDLVLLGEPTVGEGEAYSKQIEAFIAENNWQNRVHLRPYRKDTAVFYHAIDALIMATKAESIGMVTLEALASGVPVLGSNRGGTPEILGQGKYGILFESQSVQDLADKMRILLERKSNFDAGSLHASVAANDHRAVCALVEKALNLQS